MRQLCIMLLVGWMTVLLAPVAAQAMGVTMSHSSACSECAHPDGRAGTNAHHEEHPCAGASPCCAMLEAWQAADPRVVAVGLPGHGVPTPRVLRAHSVATDPPPPRA